jgi:outer membrane protein OmpA-like peptidoglycan-associated protein
VSCSGARFRLSQRDMVNRATFQAIAGVLIAVAAASAACSRQQASSPSTSSTASSPATASSTSSANAEHPQPEGLSLDATCPGVPPVDSDDRRRADDAIPLKVGLTLSYIWNQEAADPDRECLTQVTDADSTSVTVTNRCPSDADRRIVTWTRRVCRADLRDAYLYHPGTRTSNPPVIGGSTMFSLSSRAHQQLKDSGTTHHRYIYLSSSWRDQTDKLDIDRDGQLRLDASAAMPIIVNNRSTMLPVLEASGTLGGLTVRASILDDGRLPLVLGYTWSSGFSVHYSKISFPGSELEQRLATEQRVDVYGIYFDFASDALRPESEPVLLEIAKVLLAHPEWKLSIIGHTDNIGSDLSNLDLSRRRSETVRHALVDRLGIGGDRLTTAGFGAAQPKAPNDTVEGRARNRRVELVRS